LADPPLRASRGPCGSLVVRLIQPSVAATLSVSIAVFA